MMILGSLIVAMPAAAQPAGGDAAATARKFGARPAVEGVSLSPDGKRLAFIAPRAGQASTLLVVDLDKPGAPAAILTASGDPERLSRCRWIANERLICTVFAINSREMIPTASSRLVAVDADGKNVKVVSARLNERSLGQMYFGGNIIDYSGDRPGSILMTRAFVPEERIGTLINKTDSGLGVERIDTRTLARTTVEKGRNDASEYISDGQGHVRIRGMQPPTANGYSGKTIQYQFRTKGDADWKPLGKLVSTTTGYTGFNPYAVDSAQDIAYGFQDHEGRLALFSVSLDGKQTTRLLLSRPEVDVDDLVYLGRQRRVVGASYATERRMDEYFDPDVKAMLAGLHKALPQAPTINVVDASADERRMIVLAGSDTDPGRYYLFDRDTKRLSPLFAVRPAVAGEAVGRMQPVRFPAADGTMIPAYLTLPAVGAAKGLPAIVMPHGGPSARDEWGFDWLAQFFVARGYAVLQPNYRGSSGYGSKWFQKNGFQSWRTAIGDVDDGGRWLVKEGIAAPDKLAIVGWSYGGYAALQSAVTEPGLFKAAVAVAPVADLSMLRESERYYMSGANVLTFIGEGPHLREGSPLRNAQKIAVPVLLFHGTDDLNVPVAQSRAMASRLRETAKKVDYVEFKGLDHQLEDSAARTQLLEQTDTFLRAALKL